MRAGRKLSVQEQPQVHSRSVSVGAKVVDEYSSITTARPKSASINSRFPPSQAKTWESYRLEETEPLPESNRLPWEHRQRDIWSSNSRITQGIGRCDNFRSISSGKFRLPRLDLSTIQSISVCPSEEEPPSPYHEAPPKSRVEYEYAIKELLGGSNSTEQDFFSPQADYSLPSIERRSPIEYLVEPLPPIPDDQISYVGSDAPDEDDMHEDPEDGIPVYLKKKDGFGTRIRLIELRTLLMRCQALQATMNNVERKPWIHCARKPPYYHYSKMRQFAYRARKLAERLESRELLARCEYWAGRGCGGTRDWEAAAEHFTRAIQLDVKNDTYPTGTPRLRGLRPNEKEDVHFLQQHTAQRHKTWLHRTRDVRAAARHEQERTGMPIETCLDWGDVPTPTWLPEHHRIQRTLHTHEPSASASAESRDARTQTDCFYRASPRELRELHDAELTRRQLSHAEKHYILHGHKPTLPQHSTTTSPPPPSRLTTPLRSQTPSLSSPGSASSQDPPVSALNLQDELDGLWNSMTPSVSSCSEASSLSSDAQPTFDRGT